MTYGSCFAKHDPVNPVLKWGEVAWSEMKGVWVVVCEVKRDGVKRSAAKCSEVKGSEAK